MTRITIGWEAARATALFPSMEAELSAWPLFATETQLEIEGRYTPPLGAVGKALDAMVGHRIAEAAVHRFLEDVVEQIRRADPAGAPRRGDGRDRKGDAFTFPFSMSQPCVRRNCTT